MTFGIIINNIFNAILGFLPKSPLASLEYSLDTTALSYLNWFIPFGHFIAILELWLGAIALYYLYSVLLRWIKVIGG